MGRNTEKNRRESMRGESEKERRMVEGGKVIEIERRVGKDEENERREVEKGGQEDKGG